MTQPIETADWQEQDETAGTYLGFYLGRREYGLEVRGIRDVMGPADVEAVPLMPPFVEGVIHLRGKTVPVICLRQKLGLPKAPHTGETCVLVVGVNGTEMGFVVDGVSQVRELSDAEVGEPADRGRPFAERSVLGVARTDGRSITLLDLEQLMQGIKAGAPSDVSSAA
jgi:purine-binding chemotaxis protein CheW